MTPVLDLPWLDWPLSAPHRVLSWSITTPGFVTTDRIVWREVRNADLPHDLDVRHWFDQELAQSGRDGAVAMLTSRDLTAFQTARANAGGANAEAVVTVGLSNAERVGHRVDRSAKDWGTINIAVRSDTPLTEAALIEAVSIVAQARTAAILDMAHALPTGIATGTGTDCIAIAAPSGTTAFAGMHTEVGEAMGRAVYDAVHRAARIWMDTVRREGEY